MQKWEEYYEDNLTKRIEHIFPTVVKNYNRNNKSSLYKRETME